MKYTFERLRFHFIEHASQQVGQGDNAVVSIMTNLKRELERDLTEEEALSLKGHVQTLCSEADKLLRSRIPHTIPSRSQAVEIWGYQHIQTLHPDVYIHQEQPTQSDLDSHFSLPDGEVWPWNVVYTFTGPYFGIQTDNQGNPATQWGDLGSLDFVLQSAERLKLLPGCDVLGDLTLDNIDLFTLEADECGRIADALLQQRSTAVEALCQIIQGNEPENHANALIDSWSTPLRAGQQSGIAQFKRGKPIQTITLN